jgi:hypothetical protein
MNETAAPDAKVLFRVPEEDGSAEVETLWATSLGDNKFKLDNSPFYAYSVSWEDIVFAPFDENEQHQTFQRVVSKSGNRTVRVILEFPFEPGNPSDLLLCGLVALGCSYEGANKILMSINIPPAVDLEDVRTYLIDEGANWEHADPTYSELFPEGS